MVEGRTLRVAAIDCGTNSIRLLIADIEEPRAVRVAFILNRHNDTLNSHGVLFSIHDEDLPVFRLLRLRARRAPGLIEDAKFKTYGCGSAIASSSLVTEWVKGKTLDQALEIKNSHIAQELALPPVKIHCSILAEDAIKAAVQDYREKHQK